LASQWSWGRCRDRIRGLRGRLGFPDAPELEFLKLRLSLDDGSLYDLLRGRPLQEDQDALLVHHIYYLLHMYAGGEPAPETSRLVTAKQLSSGVYSPVGVEQAKAIIRHRFGESPEDLIAAAKALGGSEAGLSQADYSVRIPALPLVPVFFALWAADEEFPASSEVYFDESITSYLDVEAAGILAHITAERLEHALK
jgi:hypothetical protein